MIAADSEDAASVKAKSLEETEEDEVILEDDSKVDVDLGDDVLEDEDDDTVSLDDIADVPSEDED
jgi:phosphopantothenoylcysteine synthetase/decarboxylase